MKKKYEKPEVEAIRFAIKEKLMTNIDDNPDGEIGSDDSFEW